MDEDFIRAAYAQMGETAKGCKIIKNRHSGVPAGYCFVEFEDEESARRAMLRLNGKMIPNTKPPIRFKLNSASFGREHLRDQEYSLFIGELSEDVDDYALYSAFQRKYKSVKAAKVVIDAEGHSRGFGFIRFGDEQEQKLALIEMNHYIGLGQKPIRVSTATPKRPGSQSTGSYNNYNQNYNQYYNQYGAQNYYNQWWSAYQEPSAYGYGAGYTQPTTTTPPQTQQAVTDDSEELEDPELEFDVAKANEEFFEQSGELYVALEGSRWHPLDNYMSPIDCSTYVGS